jgi:hypothetical protein
MKPNRVSGILPVIGDLRWLGAQSVSAFCYTCGKHQVIEVDECPDSMPLSWLAAHFLCPWCRRPGAYMLPNWSAESNVHKSGAKPQAQNSFRDRGTDSLYLNNRAATLAASKPPAVDNARPGAWTRSSRR